MAAVGQLQSDRTQAGGAAGGSPPEWAAPVSAAAPCCCCCCRLLCCLLSLLSLSQEICTAPHAALLSTRVLICTLHPICNATLCRERYGLAHVYQLGTSRHPWQQEQRVYCKNIHRKRDRDGRNLRCQQCTTCHWCRQKTTSQKTQCSSCHGNKDNVYGGAYAGVICGNCLWTRYGAGLAAASSCRSAVHCCGGQPPSALDQTRRCCRRRALLHRRAALVDEFHVAPCPSVLLPAGENLHEVVRDPTWQCPACRQICNCSGAVP